MADTSSVRPTGLIRDLDVTIKGHAFRIYAVMLQLNVQGAYPLLRVRPWLRTAHIKHNWQKNIITFWRGKTKVRVATQPRATTAESHYSRLHWARATTETPVRIENVQEPVVALVDHGSEINLMSMDFYKKGKWLINTKHG